MSDISKNQMDIFKILHGHLQFLHSNQIQAILSSVFENYPDAFHQYLLEVKNMMDMDMGDETKRALKIMLDQSEHLTVIQNENQLTIFTHEPKKNKTIS